MLEVRMWRMGKKREADLGRWRKGEKVYERKLMLLWKTIEKKKSVKLEKLLWGKYDQVLRPWDLDQAKEREKN